MTHKRIDLIVLLLAMAAVVVGCANPKSRQPPKPVPEKVTEANAPTKVREAVLNRFPASSVNNIERKSEQGTILYNYELRQGGRKFKAVVTEDGTILEVAKQLLTGEAPASVAHAVQTRFPHATIGDVMEVSKVSGNIETPDYYEAAVTPKRGKEMTVKITLDGKLEEETPPTR